MLIVLMPFRKKARRSPKKSDLEVHVSQHIEATRRLFDESQDLKSNERKHYYKELVSFTRRWLLNLPDDHGVYLKTLFFQGMLPEKYEEGLRYWEPFLICLSAPSIDRGYVVSIFNQYRPLCAFDVVDLYRVHFDGKSRPEYLAVVERFMSIVEYLADKGAGWLKGEEGDFRYLYMGFYIGVFYCLDCGESAAGTIGARVSNYVESEFEEIKELPRSVENLPLLWRRLSSLLAGDAENPDLVYRDEFFVSFLGRMFERRLPLSLQNKVDALYAELPSRIEWVNGEIRFDG